MEVAALRKKLNTYDSKCRSMEEDVHGYRTSFENSQHGFQQQKELVQRLNDRVEQLVQEKTKLLAGIKRLKCQVATRD